MENSNQLLAECFNRRFGYRGADELSSFLKNARSICLPFDLSRQTRVWTFPGFVYLSEGGHYRRYLGLPPKYYYFVPGSTYGGHNPFPHEPLDKSFVASVDGMGFNMGCPLRLHFALKVLNALPEGERQEALDGLASAKKHLSAVEELFLGGIWNGAVAIRRPPPTGQKSHDWNIDFPDHGFHLECKYVPAVWPKINEDFDLLPGAFTGKAAKQLPLEREDGFLNVVAVVGMCPMCASLQSFCSSELLESSAVDVLVYTTPVGDVHIFSLSLANAQRVHSHVMPMAADDFDGWSPFAFFRPEQEKRWIARREPTRAKQAPLQKVHHLCADALPCRRGRIQPPPQAYPYRNSVERGQDGEPKFTFIAPFLPHSQDQMSQLEVLKARPEILMTRIYSRRRAILL